MTIPRRAFFFLLSLFSTSISNSICSAAGPLISNAIRGISRHGQATLTRSVPALSNYNVREGATTSISNVIRGISRHGQATLTRSVPALSIYNVREGATTSKILEVAVKRKQRKLKLPQVDVASQIEGGGFYYGIAPKILSNVSKSEGKKRLSLSDSMYEALEELRSMRQEMEMMRKEMQTLKRKMIADGEIEEDSEEANATTLRAKRRRQRESEKLASEIEQWAQIQLKETEDDGWKEVACNKMMRKTLDPTGRTTTFLKWMKDSRGDHADVNDDTEYPCLKCISTIDAPLEDVCTYLSQESAAPEYNDLIEKYKDVEDISPSAKICWSQSPQILFLKPRDFVTFCHHRWKGDDTEVILSQACDHPDYPATKEEKEGKACRAYALRGANFLSRCPDDPEKTRITIVAHANPGGGVPQWASKTAVNALVPIEPFKLFHKINVNVKRNEPELRQRLQEAEMVSTLPDGRSPRPAGMALLGYACYWPNGGGMKEGGNPQASDVGKNEDVSNMEQGAEGEREIEGEAADSSKNNGDSINYPTNEYVESS